jgi:hypothetical protein
LGYKIFHPTTQSSRQKSESRSNPSPAAEDLSMSRADSPSTPPTDLEENWWDYCPICNARLINQKCKYVCSDPTCNFFMSCSEFDL